MMHRGFTLLMSVLIASILLALGYEIYNLAVKEVTLSSAGRESQFAFFAADTGIECALHADVKLDAFATSSPLTELDCGTATTTLARSTVGDDYITEFEFMLGGGTSIQCVNVRVTREDPKRTTIESYGHNTCDQDDPVRLERAIRVTY